MSDVNKREKFLEKHQPLTPEQVYQKEKDADDSIKKYQKDIADAEDNLVNYLNKEDPLIDPGTDKAIAWIRRLPYKELKELIPDDMFDAYKEAELSGDKDTFKEVADEYEDYIFELMENMISKPEYTAKKWKEIANVNFIELFNARLTELMSRMEEQTDFL